MIQTKPVYLVSMSNRFYDIKCSLHSTLCALSMLFYGITVVVHCKQVTGTSPNRGHDQSQIEQCDPETEQRDPHIEWCDPKTEQHDSHLEWRDPKTEQHDSHMEWRDPETEHDSHIWSGVIPRQSSTIPCSIWVV